MELVVLRLLLDDPTRTLQQYSQGLHQLLGVDVPRCWVFRLFRRWGFTVKVPVYKQVYASPLAWTANWTANCCSSRQLHKFRADNMQYYQQYHEAIKEHSYLSLKFLDEASFASRGWPFSLLCCNCSLTRRASQNFGALKAALLKAFRSGLRITSASPSLIRLLLFVA